MKRFLLSISVILMTIAIVGFSPDAEAGNPARGQELAANVCASCHGLDGNLVLADDYPRLGGQHADYLEFALKAYRAGDRENAVMAPFARDLSDQDIRDLAAWFSRQKGLIDIRVR